MKLCFGGASVVLGCICALAIAVSAPAEGPPTEPPDVTLPAAPEEEQELPGGADVSAALAFTLKAQQVREETLKAPAMVQAREDSRLAYSDRDSYPEAAALLRSSFADELAALNQDPGRFLSNAQLEQRLGPTAARVSEEGRHSLLEAGVPVQARDAEGILRKIDLDLTHNGEDFTAANPLVDIEVPAELQYGIELSTRAGNLGITPVVDGGSRGTKYGDQNAFYPNIDDDRDLFVAPIARGIETFDQLRSIKRGDHGKDLFDGGAGEHDVASFAVSGFEGPIVGGQGVIVNLDGGIATQDGMDRLVGIEDVIGTAFSDDLRWSGAENVLYGAGGDDRLSGVGSRDRAVGGVGSDTCVGVEHAESCGPEARPDRFAVEVSVAGGSSGGSLTIVPRQPESFPGSPTVIFPRDISIEVGFGASGWSVAGGPELFPGEGCVAVRPVVSCTVLGEPDAVLVSGSSGNDTLVLNDSLPLTVTGLLNGGTGSDHLRGGPGDDSLNGGGKVSPSRDDVLNGGGGEDALANGAVLMGGRGSDLLIASPCSGQQIEGGPGVDSASFARSYLGVGVQVHLGGEAVFPRHKLGPRRIPAGCSLIDTQPTVVGRSIENVEGSPEDDVLAGSQAANMLLGRGGDDRIFGDSGGDFLVGGTGRDIIAGGRGNDRIYAHDGQRDQRLNCGRRPARQDVAKVDPADPLATGCRILP